MKKISTINIMPSTALEVKKTFDLLKKEILSGNENPLAVEVKLKGIEELVKMLRADTDIKYNMIMEGSKYPENCFEVYGGKFTKTTVGVKYDFTVCEDSEWELLDSNLKTAKSRLKEKEDFLKVLKKPVANPDNGEIIHPPIKTGKESISVKLM